MSVDVVADVGNSRIKWGRCHADRVAEAVSLPPDDSDSWQRQRQSWYNDRPLRWVICGVHPGRRDSLAAWARQQGDAVLLLEHARQLPLVVRLEHPDRAGIDRLLDAVAANQHRRSGTPAVLIDAGSAVTVDYLDRDGAFCGGAILPGLRLMAQALHQYTALLPVVEVRPPVPAMPGVSTRAAMEAGIFAAVVGGIRTLVRELAAREVVPPQLFLCGGDGPLLEPALNAAASADVTRYHLWPEMTLEGIRLSAGPQP